MAAALTYQALHYPRAQAQDRFDLPGFDAYVYVAMADNPPFFTVAPWGYRVLMPWLAHALPVRNVARAFRALTLGALALAGVMLYVFLRRLGHGAWACQLGVAAFGLSGPVSECVRDRFLVEPLTLLLQMSFLLALEIQAGPALLALLAVLGALAKEFFLFLPPLVFFGRRERGGPRALGAAAAVALPAVLLTSVLRFWWTPHIEVPRAPLGPELLAAGIEVLRHSWGETWRAALLGGIALLAIAGAFRAQARPFLRRYGYLVAVATVLPFVAWVNVPSLRPVALFGPNVRRLLLFALPMLLPLALHAVDFLFPHFATPPSRPTPPRRWVSALAMAGLAAVMAWPFLALDRYRRVDLQGARDGPLVLATSRESLRTASRLQRGLAVSFDPERYRFVWGVSDPRDIFRMRWFLRGGWGPLAHYGTGDMRMQEAHAEVLLPCFEPRSLTLALEMDAPVEEVIAVSVNGVRIGEARAGPSLTATVIAVPAERLFRGDNLIGLEGPGAGGARLLRLVIRPADQAGAG
jgi:hypothetical protein